MRQSRCPREVLVIDADPIPPPGVIAAMGHDSDLLDRALVGWERFLAAFEGVPDE